MPYQATMLRRLSLYRYDEFTRQRIQKYHSTAYAFFSALPDVRNMRLKRPEKRTAMRRTVTIIQPSWDSFCETSGFKNRRRQRSIFPVCGSEHQTLIQLLNNSYFRILWKCRQHPYRWRMPRLVKRSQNDVSLSVAPVRPHVKQRFAGKGCCRIIILFSAFSNDTMLSVFHSLLTVHETFTQTNKIPVTPYRTAGILCIAG